MRGQISLPLPMWGCGPTDKGARLRTLRSEFNSLHPLHSLCSRGLRHDDASVLTLFARSGDPGWIPGASSKWVGGVIEQHGSVRSCKSGFDSRPALQAFSVWMFALIETGYSNDASNETTQQNETVSSGPSLLLFLRWRRASYNDWPRSTKGM